MTEAGTVRDRLRDLYQSRAREDIVERKFERLQVEMIVDLCRAAARERLDDGEGVDAEHHVIHAHMRLNESVLKETEQECDSLFLTDRRLIRLRFPLIPGKPPSCDEGDGTRIDDLPLASITGVRTQREFRWGEAAVGAVIIAVAVLFGSWLQATGTIMAGIGVLGILHALLLPTRWVEVSTVRAGDPPQEGIRICAMRKKSARTLLKLLRERTRG